MLPEERHNMHSHYQRAFSRGPLIAGGVLVWPELFNNNCNSRNPKKNNRNQHEGRDHHETRRTR